MKTNYLLISIILFFANPSWSLNLERFEQHIPEFFVHSLDVEINDDRAFVTGNGGFMIYDISEGVEYLGRFITGGGRGVAFNSCANDETGFVAVRGIGLYIIDISDPRRPTQLARWQPRDESIEDCAIIGDLLIAPAHQDGIHFLDVSDPGRPEEIGTFQEVENAWEIALDDSSNLYIADGPGGLIIMNLSDEPEVLSSIETSGNAIDVKVSGGRCAVASGASGVDIFDITNPEEPTLIGHFDTPTYAGHIGFDGDLVAVADWDEVLVYDVSDPDSIVLSGSRYTEYRAMGVDIKDEKVYLADWSKFIGYDYGLIQGADIAFSTRRIIPPDDQLLDTSLIVFNYGLETLEVNRVRCNARNFEIDQDNFEVEPGDSIELNFTFQPSESNNYPLQFSTNDTDDPNSSIILESSGGLGVADEAPDFTARILGGGQYRLSDMSDRIQLIIFWTSW